MRQILLITAFCAACLFGYQFWSDRLIAEGYEKAEAEINVTKLAAERVARGREQALHDNLTKAQANAQIRQNRLTTDATDARTESDGLRDDLIAANARLSSATRVATIEYARAANDVLAECSRRYQDMAATADGHANDAVMLIDGWPRNLPVGNLGR